MKIGSEKYKRKMYGIIEKFTVNEIPKDSVVMLRVYQKDEERSELVSVICDDGIIYEFNGTKKITAIRLEKWRFSGILKRLEIYDKHVIKK